MMGCMPQLALAAKSMEATRNLSGNPRSGTSTGVTYSEYTINLIQTDFNKITSTISRVIIASGHPVIHSNLSLGITLLALKAIITCNRDIRIYPLSICCSG